LSAAPSVKELCVLGHTQTGGFKQGTEEVCMVVVPEDSLRERLKGDEPAMQKALAKEIDGFAQDLAAYKRPTRIFVYPGELPKTATRKVKRAPVAQWLRATFACM
jgi:acyl-coenzyme A synthetase/AMP-(fatty) acid ligase